MTNTNVSISGGQVSGIIGAHTVYVNNLTIGPAPVFEFDVERPATPYPGLSYFTPNQSELFFGRETAIGRLATLVDGRSLTAIVGASGCGKSSLVLAGLAPFLARQGSWTFTYFRLGLEIDDDPFRALARALVAIYYEEKDLNKIYAEVNHLSYQLRSGEIKLMDALEKCRGRNPEKKLLLIADQFEEIFLLVKSDELRNKFIDTLIEPFQDYSQGVNSAYRLVLTLRADFFGHALSHRQLSDALQDRVEHLGPLSRSELFDAIIRPAKKVGVLFEEGLVELIVADVSARNGMLPLLQFTLREMCLRLEMRTLTHRGYQEIGGVKGALAKRAEDIYQHAKVSNSDRQDAFRRLFTRLVATAEGIENARRTASRHELADDCWTLAQELAGENNRLLLIAAVEPGKETVEIVHEALIENWPTLLYWIAGDRQFQIWLQQMQFRLREWEQSPNDSGTLLAGGLLAAADNWLAKRDKELSPSERNYIFRSRQARDTEIVNKERQRRRVLTLVSVLALVSAVSAVSLGLFARSERSAKADAKEQAALAATRARFLPEYMSNVALSEAARGAEANARALAVSALMYQQDDSVSRTNEAAILSTYFRKSTYSIIPGTHPSVDSHRKKIAVYSSSAEAIDVFDTVTGVMLERVPTLVGTLGGTIKPGPMVYTKLSGFLISLPSEFPLDTKLGLIWPLHVIAPEAKEAQIIPLPMRLEELSLVPRPGTDDVLVHGETFAVLLSISSEGKNKFREIRLNSRVKSATFREDGNAILFVTKSGEMFYWDSQSDQVDLGTRLALRNTNVAVFAGDRNEVISVDLNGKIGLSKLTPSAKEPIRTSAAMGTSLSISEYGKYLSFVTERGSVTICDSSGKTLYDLSVSVTEEPIVRFNEKLGLVAVGLSTGEINVVDLNTGIKLLENHDLEQAISQLEFITDSNLLVASAMRSSETTLIEVPSSHLLWKEEGIDEVVGAEFSGDSKFLYVYGKGGIISVRASDGGAIKRPFEENVLALSAGLSEDRIFFAHSFGGNLTVSAITPDGRLLSVSRSLPMRLDQVEKLSLQAATNGVRIAVLTSELPKSLKILSLDSELKNAVEKVLDVSGVDKMAFSPDASKFAISDGPQVLVWSFDENSPTPRFSYQQGAEVVSLQISLDGKFVVSGSTDGNVVVYDLKTRSLVHNSGCAAGQFCAGSLSPDGHRILMTGAQSWSPSWGGQPAFAAIETILSESNKQRVELLFHRDRTNFGIWSSNGRLALTGGSVDGKAALWDAKTGLHITSFSTSSYLESATISRDDSKLVTVSEGGKIILWQMPAVAPKMEEIFNYSRGISLISTIDQLAQQRLYLEDVLRVAIPAGLPSIEAKRLEDCLLYGSHPNDPKKIGKGVPFHKIPASQVVEFCESIVEKNKSNGLFLYVMYRIMEAAKKNEEALRYLHSAAELKYPEAIVQMAENGDFSFITLLSENEILESKSPRMVYQFAMHLQRNNAASDKILRILALAESLGSHQAGIELAKRYALGNGVKRNIILAYEKSAKAVFLFESKLDVVSREYRILRYNLGRKLDPEVVSNINRDLYKS